MIRPFVVAEVWDQAGTTLIAELPRRWDVQFSDPLNVPGVGQVTVALDDAVLTRHPGLLDLGNVVKFWQGRGDGTGGYTGAFRIRHRKSQFVSADEWSGYVRTVTGPTLLGDLDQGIVAHETPPTSDSSDMRAFFWGSSRGEWYNSADWDTAYNSWQWLSNPPSNAKTGQPAGWPDPGAYWLNSSDTSWEFWRYEVTVPVDTTVEVSFTCDEIGRVWVDGNLLIQVDEFETGYLGYTPQKWVLTAGATHVFAVMVLGKTTPGGDGNDAFLLSCYRVDENDTPGKVLVRSSASGWVTHGNTPPPGWRKALILKKAIEEAQARAVRYLSTLSIGWTAATSSDGVAWTDVLSRNVAVGTTVLDLQSQLSEMQGLDVWVRPDDMTILAYAHRGTDKTASVALVPGGALLDWAVEEDDAIRNAGPVKYDGGWIVYSDDASVTAHGRAEISLTLGSVADDETATVLASSIVETMNDVQRQAGASEQIVRNEDDQVSGSLTWAPQMHPGLDYGTGDTVLCPNRDAVLTAHRLLGLATAEDNATGALSWDPELEEV